MRVKEYIKNMEFAQWEDKLSVEIDLIDDQHKILIKLINDTSKMIMKKNDKGVGEILRELLDWTDKHFAEEEELFSATEYPDIKKHKEEHGYFINKIKELMEDRRNRDVDVSLNILQFLKNWLFYHIEIIDKTYAPYVIKMLKDM